MNDVVKEKAGVVIHRKNKEGNVEVLLISARKFSDSWVFPVGTVEKGETLREAAARECAEESGYIVKTGKEIGSELIGENGAKNRFTFYSAETTGRETEYENDRKRLWVNLEELKDKIAPVFVGFADKFIKEISEKKNS